MEEKGKSIRVITVKYNTNIQHLEIPFFRGAIIASMGNDADLLYHNHIDNEKLRYSYPLIQYKRIGGKAAVVYINEACELLKQNLTLGDVTFTLGTKEITTRMENVAAEEVKLDVQKKNFKYKIYSWVPFNSDNYDSYLRQENLIGRIELMQNILKANILSMAKGLGILFDKQIEVTIMDIERKEKMSIKGVEVQTFDMTFKCNVSLPNNIGLGKAVSKGHGIIQMIKKVYKHG